MNEKTISYDEIGPMQTAITNYVNDVNAHMNTIKEMETFSTNASGFFGDQQVATVNSYIDGTCDQIASIVTRFETFSNALNDIKTDYDSKQAAIKTPDIKEADKVTDDQIISVNKFSA